MVTWQGFVLLILKISMNSYLHFSILLSLMICLLNLLTVDTVTYNDTCLLALYTSSYIIKKQQHCLIVFTSLNFVVFK